MANKRFCFPQLADKFNSVLLADPEDNRLAYTVRDMLVTHGEGEPAIRPRGTARAMRVGRWGVVMSRRDDNVVNILSYILIVSEASFRHQLKYS